MLCELVMPIGTSLLGWLGRVDPTIVLPIEWVGHQANARADAPIPVLQQWIPKLTARLFDQERTSAELDSTRAWLEEHKSRQVSRIHLLVSDTAAANWVAKVVEALLPKLSEMVIEVRCHTIPQLNAKEMRQGLVEFIRIAARIIKDAQGRGAFAVVNATPGFKAETSLLTLLGAALGTETIYLHEQMKTVITIPALPLRWDLKDTEIEALAHIGDATSRDMLRDLDLGNRPHLWPFLVRVGEGKDQIWAISALGEIVVESSHKMPQKYLRARDGDLVFKASASEAGHQPADAEALANAIGKKLEFVQKIVLYGWEPLRPAGLMHPREDDKKQRVVRLRVRSEANDDLMLLFSLHTTADTETQWQIARQRAAEIYGRISLLDELAEDGLEPKSSYAEMMELRLETVWQDKLMVARSVAREAQERERNANDARDRAIRDAEKYERKWRDAKRESSEKQKQIDTLKRERDELQREIASIRTSMDAGDADGA